MVAWAVPVTEMLLLWESEKAMSDKNANGRSPSSQIRSCPPSFPPEWFTAGWMIEAAVAIGSGIPRKAC
jgi:hypothetical protein